MTLDEFVEALRAERGFQMNTRHHPTLRRFNLDTFRTFATDCPLTAVCNTRRGVRVPIGDFELAGDLLGLPKKETVMIMRSADGAPGTFNPDLRARMMNALGLAQGQ